MTGTFTYLPSNTNGRIRLLIGDTEQNEASFSDEELAAFLDMAGDSLKEAGAIAYETWARNQAKIARVMEERGFRNEREAISALLAAADAIRNADIGTVGTTAPRRIATSQNENDGGYKKNVRPLGNIKQDYLEDRTWDS
jgi:hypothetical protein